MIYRIISIRIVRRHRLSALWPMSTLHICTIDVYTYEGGMFEWFNVDSVCVSSITLYCCRLAYPMTRTVTNANKMIENKGGFYKMVNYNTL